jgi:hypothetical protein
MSSTEKKCRKSVVFEIDTKSIELGIQYVPGHQCDRRLAGFLFGSNRVRSCPPLRRVTGGGEMTERRGEGEMGRRDGATL